MELLATVHCVMTHEDARSPDEVIRRTYERDGRKEQFTERQILLVQKILEGRGWVDEEVSAPA